MVRSFSNFALFTIRLVFAFVVILPSSMAALPNVGQSAVAPCLERFVVLGKMDMEIKSPGYARLLSGRVYDRLERSQPEGFRSVTEAISKSANGKSVRISSGDLSASVTTSIENGVLEIKIGHVKINDSEKARKGKVGKLSFGKQNPSLNMGFPRFLVAIADGIELQLAKNPSVREVSITGKTVVNTHLIQQLRDLGFESGVPTASTFLMATKRNEGGYGTMFFGALSFMNLIPPQHLKETKVAMGALKTFSGIRYRDYARDWKIVFKVKPEN